MTDLTKPLNEASDRLEAGETLWALPAWAHEIDWFATHKRGLRVRMERIGSQWRISA